MLSSVVREDEGKTRLMIRKRLTAGQIIHKFREAEVELSPGRAIAEACKKIGVTD